MKYLYPNHFGRLTLLLFSLLTLSLGARAQSGPYGNEWIVPGQAYYKIKITKDGIYRLDQAYLTRAGIGSGTNPQRIQLWRRGREVAMYGGGNQAQLDATTFFEFFGQRNDGALDRGMYKNAATDQPHKFYSLFTDTAAYFLTVSATANGRRMTEMTTAATGTVHPSWLQNRLRLLNGTYNFGQTDTPDLTFFPWADKGEGFLSPDVDGSASWAVDSLFRRATTGAQAWMETVLVGAHISPHYTNILALPGGSGTARLLNSSTITYTPYQIRRVILPLQRSDFGSNGQIGFRFERSGTTVTDKFCVGYIRVVSPQNSYWPTRQKAVHFWSDSTLAGAAYYTLDSIPATVVGYDVTDPTNVLRTTGTALSGLRRAYGFANAIGSTHKLVLADMAQPLVPTAAQRVSFRSLNPSGPNFIIVTSKALMGNVGGVPNPVRTYATYRATAGAGRIAYDTLVVTADLLYDQFHYGERSPLAVRQFAQYMQTGSRNGQYLLLLGKGTLISENGNGLSTNYRQTSAAERAMSPDYVPCSTRGGSDIFFTADWQNGNYVPRMITGRVAARTPAQVTAYLNKLQAHEPPTYAAWRKNILHLAGGENANEHRDFRGYLRNYQRRAEKPFLAAYVDSIVSNSTSQLTVDFTPQLNAGLSLITYFGHGSNRTIDLTPVDIMDPRFNYANQNKYPVFFGVGCAIGSSFGAYGSITEDWMLSANKGAVGWLADSDFGTDYDQNIFADTLYRLAFNHPQWYGKPIAAIQREVLRRLQANFPSIPNSNSGQAMMTNINWQGDPALSLYSPDKPDYLFTPNTAAITVEPALVLSSTPNFNLRIRLSNYGKIEPVRRIQITTTRTAPSGSITVPPITIPYFLRDTTVVIPINNPSAALVFGNNTFTVKIDDPNNIPELDENNNTATITYYIRNGGITILNPTPYAIVGRANVKLVGQSNTPVPLGSQRRYEFQLDTIPTFSSPINSTTFDALDVASWRPNLPTIAGRDSVVYYWRMRFALTGNPVGQDNSWVTSSFRFINGNSGGWSQSHYGQMVDNAKSQMTQNVPSGKWDFGDISGTVQLRTVGMNTPDLSYSTFLTTYGISLNGQLISAANCGQTGLNADPNISAIAPHDIIAAVIDPVSLQIINNIPGGNYRKCGDIAGGKTLFFFSSAYNRRDSLNNDNINTARRQGQLLAFLQNIPNGAYVALVSANRVNYTNFRADLKAQLVAMGSQLINTVQDGDPLAILFRKGFPAQTQEQTFSATDPTPRYDQIITLTASLTGRNTSGTITSTRVGPAQQWQNLYYTIKRPDGVATDQYTLRLVGYDANNSNRTVINPNITTPGSNGSLSLTGLVNAQQFPYLALELELRDVVNRTPPQLKQWLITYKGLPEGTVRRDHPAIPANAYAASTLSAAASSTGVLDIPVYFENVSNVDFAGLTRAKAYITQRSNGQQDTVSVRATRLAGFSLLPRADSTAVYNFRLNVAARSGDLDIRIVANANRLPEQTDINNELNLTLTAPSITLAPVLDVAFDGQHILNGDIVSTQPEIAVDVRYEDKRRPLTDPSKVDLYLTKPDGTTVHVDMTNTNVVNFVNNATQGRSRVLFRPAQLLGGTDPKLPDGIYTLEAQARDMANNAVASQLYAVKFEVISATTITNVFPYPNPVTSKARFVFTLTGTTPPRNMKIQILTISGKVVREITQAELGNVHVGNNITDFAWDCTDSYGDQLANGTYLYRVVLDDPNGDYKQRRTAADQAFKKGWGKLVLLR